MGHICAKRNALAAQAAYARSMRTLWRWTATLAALTLTMACGEANSDNASSGSSGSSGAGAGQPAGPTWWGDVAPIVYADPVNVDIVEATFNADNTISLRQHNQHLHPHHCQYHHHKLSRSGLHTPGCLHSLRQRNPHHHPRHCLFHHHKFQQGVWL